MSIRRDLLLRTALLRLPDLAALQAMVAATPMKPAQPPLDLPRSPHRPARRRPQLKAVPAGMG